MYVDPQKVRQEQLERERKARLERERKARIERERQEKLKRDAKAKEDAKAREKAKAEGHPDKKPKGNKKPQSENKPQTTPHPSIQASPNPFTPQTTAPIQEAKPKAPLNRMARQWSGEQPDPTPIAKPQLTEDQQHLLKVQQAEQAGQAIWKNNPSNKASLNLTYQSSLAPGQQPASYYDQWHSAAQRQVGLGDPKGIDQYFQENRKSLKTLDWLLQTNLNPDLQTHNPELNTTHFAGRGGSYTNRTNYYKSEYQDYLAPPQDPTHEHVQLAALKKGTLEQLTGQAPVNGVEIVRQVFTKDAQGQLQSTTYTKGKEGWVPLKGLNPDQIIVTVNAPVPTSEGKQPGTLSANVNIAGAEEYTHKQYNTIKANYQTYIDPTFTQYQQLRGDTPRQLSGSNLRNEIGVAMNFTPNNAPLTEADQKALQSGNWDLFSPDKISPALAQSMSPPQQEKLKAQLKEQHEALTKIEGKVKEIGGDSAKVTTLPIMVDSPDIGGVMQVPLFRVSGKDGKDRFIDNTGRVYDNFQNWKDNNKLPAGRVSYFADGHISSNKDGKPNIVTENTHAVVDTPWEHVKQVGDWVATGVGVLVGAAAIGALILGTGGLATPLVIAGAGAALWGAGNAANKLYDRNTHGETLSLADAEARSAWIDLAANGVGFAAIGSSIRAGSAISKVMATADEAGVLSASAREVSQAVNLGNTSRVLNAASTVTDGAALADSTYGLAKGWDRLSPEQRLMAISQIGFWGGMMSHGAYESMGNNFYASKDVDAFMKGVASRPKESLTQGDGITRTGTREERIEQLRQQQLGGQTQEELRARLIELKRQQDLQQQNGAGVKAEEPAAKGYDRTYPSATNKPRGLNMTLEEIRQRYGDEGVVTVQRTEQRAQEIINSGESKRSRGPVVSGITDPLTGKTYFGQNFTQSEIKGGNLDKFEAQLHPLLKQRLSIHKHNLEAKLVKLEDSQSLIKAGEPGSHSEIRALDQALKDREAYTGKPVSEAELSSFLLHNRSLKDPTGVPPRCVNCWHVTDGVTVIGND